MFCFLIDPTDWAEIDGQAFAPGFFAWNSEVGKRSIGISTFWFQVVCQNHILWDAVEVVEVSRKHTVGVHSAPDDVRRTLDSLVQRRDERRDGFVRLMQKAMHEKLGTDADEVVKLVSKRGINRQLAKQALDLARQEGAFTIFAVVDALTRLSQQSKNAGERLGWINKPQGCSILSPPLRPAPTHPHEATRWPSPPKKPFGLSVPPQAAVLGAFEGVTMAENAIFVVDSCRGYLRYRCSHHRLIAEFLQSRAAARLARTLVGAVSRSPHVEHRGPFPSFLRPCDA
jgi:hypothetical protein